MKYLILLLTLACNLPTFSQTNIERLRDQYQAVSSKINTLNDSLLIIKDLIKKEEIIDNLQRVKSAKLNIVKVEVSTNFCNLHESDDPSSKTLTSIPNGTIVEIIDIGGSIGNFLKTEYQNKIGFIIDVDVRKTPELINFSKTLLYIRDQEKEKINREKQMARIKIDSEAAELKKKELIRKFGPQVADKILSRIPWIGMTDEMAIQTVGLPQDNNRSITSGRIDEQWVYSRGMYLYFTNGILTTIQY